MDEFDPTVDETVVSDSPFVCLWCEEGHYDYSKSLIEHVQYMHPETNPNKTEDPVPALIDWKREIPTYRYEVKTENKTSVLKGEDRFKGAIL